MFISDCSAITILSLNTQIFFLGPLCSAVNRTAEMFWSDLPRELKPSLSWLKTIVIEPLRASSEACSERSLSVCPLSPVCGGKWQHRNSLNFDFFSLKENVDFLAQQLLCSKLLAFPLPSTLRNWFWLIRYHQYRVFLQLLWSLLWCFWHVQAVTMQN